MYNIYDYIRYYDIDIEQHHLKNLIFLIYNLIKVVENMNAISSFIQPK